MYADGTDHWDTKETNRVKPRVIQPKSGRFDGRKRPEKTLSFSESANVMTRLAWRHRLTLALYFCPVCVVHVINGHEYWWQIRREQSVAGWRRQRALYPEKTCDWCDIINGRPTSWISCNVATDCCCRWLLPSPDLLAIKWVTANQKVRLLMTPLSLMSLACHRRCVTIHHYGRRRSFVPCGFKRLVFHSATNNTSVAFDVRRLLTAGALMFHHGPCVTAALQRISTL